MSGDVYRAHAREHRDRAKAEFAGGRKELGRLFLRCAALALDAAVRLELGAKPPAGQQASTGSA
jgi:hypothetical protein